MLMRLPLTRRMAAIASLSKLVVSPGSLQACAFQASASAAHIDTRLLLSARTVYSFSAGQSSPFTECGNRHRVGTLGAQGFSSSEIKRKRMVTSAALEPQADSRQYFALTYDYVPDILEKRGPHRAEHLALAQAHEDEGKMLLGGAWGAPVDGALFIWLVNSADEIQQFVDKDPYVENGLVTKIDIRPVAAAVGTWVSAKK